MTDLSWARPKLAEWLPMPDCPGYLVSYRGDVFSEKTNRILRLSVDVKGRLRANLFVRGKRKGVIVGRMVLRAFGGNAPTYKHVACHNDGDPTNNHISNLRWCTYAENTADTILHGTHRSGTNHQRSKLTRIQIKKMLTLYRSGMSQPEIAKRFKVNVSTVNRVLCGRSYPGVTASIIAAMGWEAEK